ncbi:nuclear transport factor 2 [Cystoisospora suis]|uniref:Nuclear transport factor 2 n=1 Tax=Cystoisospora suis TaxID=483139 RepID=A0A2C6KTB6_9APIC|nr:nuclear transport factor 2 [Cystoisospora suis]
MQLNPQFDAIGKQFVQHYYATFGSQREKLAELYTEQSMLTYENEQFQGTAAIVTKLQKLPLVVKHSIITCDCQPTPNNGIVVLVSGGGGRLAFALARRREELCVRPRHDNTCNAFTWVPSRPIDAALSTRATELSRLPGTELVDLPACLFLGTSNHCRHYTRKRMETSSTRVHCRRRLQVPGFAYICAGDLAIEDNPPMKFCQAFNLVPNGGGGYAVFNDIFRLCIG